MQRGERLAESSVRIRLADEQLNKCVVNGLDCACTAWTIVVGVAPAGGPGDRVEEFEGAVLLDGKRYVAVCSPSAGVLDEFRVFGYEDFAGRSYDVATRVYGI